MSKRNYLGGLLGAQTSRQGSFTDPGAVDRYVPNVGMLSLGEAAVETVGSKDLPMLPWGGIKGRDVFSLVSVDLGEGWNWTETALVGSDISASGDYCGADSAMSGDGSIIVAGSSPSAKNKVYVFENGTQVAQLTASDGATSDRFGGAGIAVSNDGNTIAVGARSWDSGGSYTDGGAIYVYEKPGGGWASSVANATENARLTDGFQARNADFLGRNISISSDGSTIVGASHKGNASLANPGAGLVYVRPGAAGTWANTTTPTATLTRSTRNSNEDVNSVAISQDGSTIAVGFSSADVNGSNNGVVCIYDKPGGGWANATEDHVLQPGTLAATDHLFGRAVSLSSDGTYMAAVSRSGVSGSGYSTAYMFSTNGTTWTEDAVLSMEDQGTQYAESVAITSDGSRVVAGASFWNLDGTTTSCGCIYIWDKPASGWADKDYDQIITADAPLTNGYLTRNLYTGSNNLGITNDGKTITAGYYKYNGNLGAVLELSGLPTPGNAVNVIGTADMTTTGILGLSDHYTALNRAETIPPVYTFEMWGSGGGGGGYNTSATTTNENSGPGGGGAYVSGTLTGITSGTTLELMVGHVGTSGIGGGNNVATSGNGGGASAIRIQSGAIVAAAGGGGGGGASGASMSYDSTGGRGGNSVDGSAVTATQAGDFYAGSPGMSGTSTAAGTQATNTNAEPPTKTEDLQDGGDGMSGRNLFTGGGTTNNTNPASWGGSGGTGSVDYQAEAAGGAGGGGYFGGSGGTGATAGNDGTSGGGGGGSYVNATYVSSYSSEEGSWEDATAHAAAAPTQAAGSSSSQFAAGVGEGGSGWGATVTSETPEDGNPGAVYILLDGVVVASITAGGTETTYTIP